MDNRGMPTGLWSAGKSLQPLSTAVKQILPSNLALSKGGPVPGGNPRKWLLKRSSITGCALLIVNDNVLLPQSIKLSDSREKEATVCHYRDSPTEASWCHPAWNLAFVWLVSILCVLSLIFSQHPFIIWDGMLWPFCNRVITAVAQMKIEFADLFTSSL